MANYRKFANSKAKTQMGSPLGTRGLVLCRKNRLSQWRLLPANYPPWPTVYLYFRRYKMQLAESILLKKRTAWFVIIFIIVTSFKIIFCITLDLKRLLQVKMMQILASTNFQKQSLINWVEYMKKLANCL